MSLILYHTPPDSEEDFLRRVASRRVASSVFLPSLKACTTCARCHLAVPLTGTHHKLMRRGHGRGRGLQRYEATPAMIVTRESEYALGPDPFNHSFIV